MRQGEDACGLEASSSSVRVFLGLGSNEGNREAHLRHAVVFLRSHPNIRFVRVSSVFETPPVGGVLQGPYLNAVAELETSFSPLELLSCLKSYEVQAGRREGIRFGPRPIDLDILIYGEQRILEPGLEVPHPRMRERAFVLVPLAELEPLLVLPGDTKNVEAWKDGQPDLAEIREQSIRL